MMNKTINNVSPSRLTVAIVGTGNVATHLHRAFEGKANVFQVNPHSFEGMPLKPDFVIISVKDSVIAEVAKNILPTKGIVAHTSGSVPMTVLAPFANEYGVFYPLQTFSKDVPLDYSEIPFFIEGNNPETTSALCNLARLISTDVHIADSEARKTLHLASVFACNFSNAMIGIGAEILADAGMDYHLLLPLLRQTVAKLDKLSPSEAQTGPAVRKDFPVINAHLKMLEEKADPGLAEIYENLTNMIIIKRK